MKIILHFKILNYFLILIVILIPYLLLSSRISSILSFLVLISNTQRNLPDGRQLDGLTADF